MNYSLALFHGIFMAAFLFGNTWSMPYYISGTVTETQVTHFEFIQKLGNPCGITRMEEAPVVVVNLDSGASANSNYNVVDETENQTPFYQSMLIAVDSGLDKLKLLQSASSGMSNCNGLNLESLPPTPSLSNLSEDQLFQEIYKSSIFLSTHLHLMGIDRQINLVLGQEVSDSDVDERTGLPTWRFQKCSNETEQYVPRIMEMTEAMENILCTLIISANPNQRALFRAPFNQLMSTTFLRYHSSCSDFLARDCIVLKNTKQMLLALKEKVKALMASASRTGTGTNSV